MRKTLGVSLLLLLLSGPASAGIMQNDAPAPPPQPPTGTQESASSVTVAGETPAGTADILTQIVSDVFAALPSLL